MFADRVEETTTTQGTGDLVLGGAPAGRRTFISGIGAGNLCYAVCTDGQAEYEVFEGVVNAGSPPTITRPTILESSNNNLAINWGPGVKTVQAVPVAEAFGPIGNRHRWVGTTGGTSGNYTGTAKPAPRTLIDGMIVYARANHNSPSTGATFNLNSKGAKPIRVRDGTFGIGDKDVVTGQVIELLYDQSSDTWRLLSAYGLDDVATIVSTNATTASGPIWDAYRQAQVVLSMNIGNQRVAVQNTSGVRIQIGDVYYNAEVLTLGAESFSRQWQTMYEGTLDYRMRLMAGLVIGSATGGDKGPGTLNATGVYDDNVLLTCYPLALAAHGSTSLAVWDRAAHRRREHKAARRFIKRWREWLDPKSYGSFWREHGHLPAMPSPAEWEAREKTIPVGELIQRLWETADTQAVHIERLRAEIEEMREDARRRNARDAAISE